jgi:hypothetical protein
LETYNLNPVPLYAYGNHANLINNTAINAAFLGPNYNGIGAINQTQKNSVADALDAVRPDRNGDFSYRGIARRKPGVTVAAARAAGQDRWAPPSSTRFWMMKNRKGDHMCRCPESPHIEMEAGRKWRRSHHGQSHKN